MGATRVAEGNWLSRALAPSRGPVPWLGAVRAAVAFGAVIAVSLALDEPRAGLLAAAGMVLATMRPDTGPYRSRALGLVVSQLAGAAGLVVGPFAHGSGWATVTMTTAVALLSGLVSSVGNVASGASLALLFMNVIGTGLPRLGSWWLPPLCQLAGGAFYLVLAVLSWRSWSRRPGPEHRAVADVYGRAADLIDAAPHPGDARLELSMAVDTAQDALMCHRVRDNESWGEEARWLVAMLNAATPLLEALTLLIRSERPAPPGLSEAVRRIADAVRTGDRDAGIAPFRGDPAFARPVEFARRRLSETHPEDPDWLGLPPPLPARAYRAARMALTTAAAWRYGLRLALCMAIASAFVEFPGVLHDLWIPTVHSVWLPLTVAVVLKPDFGSVFVRSLLRAVGTVAAAVPTLLVLAAVPRGWAAVPLAAVLGGLIPVLKARSYAMRTVAVTPLMLFLFDMTSPQPSGELVLARLSDTLLGCVIVMVFGYALWPWSRRVRIGERFTAGIRALADYLDEAFTGPRDVRARDRRALHRSLDAVRADLRQIQSEPPPAGRTGAAWLPVLGALDALVDTVTAASVKVRGGAEPPPERAVGALSAELREMAAAIRDGRPQPTRGLPGPSGEGVLGEAAVQARRLRRTLPL
ncbi:putative membrane protein YccC [Actinomadura coerulea]|uniref:Putative membrane protein YccC n=1 Tax=Actinomadura coerulea TaxID=46159 RepID=A0A7X0G031_9ACTN|nr:FUSC family protein [Actinomadura coerulea]MBB6396938.1 putative membrane protein YccC [Actinomadura coerulea]